MARAKLTNCPLPDAQIYSPLCQHIIVAVVQVHNKLMGAHRFGGGYHVFVAGLFVAVTDIFPYRSGEQIRFLEHHAHLTDQRPAVHVPNIMAVHGDLALSHIGEAVHQRNQSSLACPRGPDQGDVLPGKYLQVHILQDIDIWHIVEADSLELYVPADRRRISGLLCVVDLRLKVQHFKDPHSRGHGPL